MSKSVEVTVLSDAEPEKLAELLSVGLAAGFIGNFGIYEFNEGGEIVKRSLYRDTVDGKWFEVGPKTLEYMLNNGVVDKDCSDAGVLSANAEAFRNAGAEEGNGG